MRGIWIGVAGGWVCRCERCLYAIVRVVIGSSANRDDEQKKRPFQILRSSMVVNVRPEPR